MKNNTIHYGRTLNLIGVFAVAVILLSIFTGCTLKQANTQVIPQAVTEALNSTVRLVLKDAEGESLEISSGFFVRRDLIVTNLHVVENAVKRDSYAQLVGKKTKYEIQDIIRSQEYSLAILKVNAPSVKFLPLGSSDNIRIGNRIYVVGNPPKQRNRISIGKTKKQEKNLLDNAKLEIWEIIAPISPKISGGPVLNDRGKVIGVSAWDVRFKKPAFKSRKVQRRPSFALSSGKIYLISSRTLKALLSELDLANP